MNNSDISQWFGLKKSNFILNPETDADFYAPRTSVNIPSIVESLQINLVTGLPPKRLFWGRYGGGKTHTLFKVTNELAKLLPIKSVYVECPNLGRSSTFLHLYHDGIMASMGQEFTINLFEDLIKKFRLINTEQLRQKLKESIGTEELSRAIASLLGADDRKRLSFWRYISGVNVPSKDVGDLGQTQDLTNAEPSRLAEIIISVGKILKSISGETLVLILDELDRLEFVGGETGSTFQNAFRKLVDPNQRDVAILMGCSADNLRTLPEVFGGELGPVLSRIGQAGLQEIPAIDLEDVNRFIKDIINHIRIAPQTTEDLLNSHKDKTSENISLDFYPFTDDAIEALKGELQEIMTPREIIQRMTQAVGKAYLLKQPIVTKAILE